jgi:SSS family solute:Na+ symporter
VDAYFLPAAFSRVKKSGAAIAGIIAGILIILWLSAGPPTFGKSLPGGHLHSYLTVVFGTMAIFIAPA